MGPDSPKPSNVEYESGCTSVYFLGHCMATVGHSVSIGYLSLDNCMGQYHKARAFKLWITIPLGDELLRRGVMVW